MMKEYKNEDKKCMRSKWIPIKNNYELNDVAMVTRRIGTGLDVTIGLPGWGLQNDTVAFMPLPKNIIEAPDNWKSEYRGDDLPEIKKNRCYLAQLQGTAIHNKNKLKIINLCYQAREHRWLAIPPEWEVVGWAEYPRPYTK